IVHLLEHPPHLRPYGFDWRTESQTRIVQGQLRRVLIPEGKILDLWTDGTLIAAGRGDGWFLSWNKPQNINFLRINPVVLIESAYAFAELSKQVFNFAQPHPRGIEYRLVLRNMTVNGKPCRLPLINPAGLWEILGFSSEAPDAGAAFSVSWDED